MYTLPIREYILQYNSCSLCARPATEPSSQSITCHVSSLPLPLPLPLPPPIPLPLPPPSLSPGKRRKPASSGSSSAASTRSNSVKRETTPVARATNITITHSQPVNSKPTKLSDTGGRRRPPPTIQRRGGISSAPSYNLDCNEEIAMDDNDDDEEEEEGECSATQCLQPVADQIIWVQCDHCHEWFHCICVGLTKEYAEQIDTYKCASCKQAAITAVPPTTSVVCTSLSSQQPSYLVNAGAVLPVAPSLSSSGQT